MNKDSVNYDEKRNTPSHNIPEIDVIDLENDGTGDVTFSSKELNAPKPRGEDGSDEPDVDGEYTAVSKRNSPAKRTLRSFLNVHILLVLVFVIVVGVVFSRLSNWGVYVDLSEIFKDGQGTYEDTMDQILPLLSQSGEIMHGDADTIVLFGNAPFADDRDAEDNLGNMIAKATNATVYNCSIDGSYLAAQSPFYNPAVAPVDAFNFYWLSCLTVDSSINHYFEQAQQHLGDDMPEAAWDVFETLSTLDFNTVDVIAIMYDASDYLSGHKLYNSDNPTDITYFAGNLEAGIELFQTHYPHIRIIVMSPTYAFAVNENGEYVSSDMYTYGDQDVLSSYMIFEATSSSARSVTFIDHLYGTITEDNAKDYLIDNLHLNVRGRKLVTERFLDALTYYDRQNAAD